MSQLASLRRRIASLHRWRAVVRGVTAWSAVLIALLWILAVMFVVDVVFEMDVPQRAFLMTVGVVIAGWAFVRYSRPLWRVRESLTQVALLVERQHGIRSDLVAALQFETPAASQWGSTQLEQAVIGQVADRSRRMNVFEGFSHPQARRRMSVLLLTVGVLAAAIALFPEYARVFARRLALAGDHYPSATRIDVVTVNQQVVLQRSDNPTRPRSIAAAEGLPITFRIQASRRLPDGGRIKLRASTGRQRTLVLERLTLDQRRELLADAAARIRQAVDQGDVDMTGPWSETIVSQLRFDVPEAAEMVQDKGLSKNLLPSPSSRGEGSGERGSPRGSKDNKRDTADWLAVAEAVDKRLAEWPTSARRTAVYECRLNRLVDPISYRLYLGDAWTDPAEVRMIPLPVVELAMDATPPKYAAAGDETSATASNRQLSVLEGSEVHVSLECTNAKKLASAWLTVLDAEGPQRFDMTAVDSQSLRWALPPQSTPFEQITRETRFELQVTDEDGLHLETPLRGYVRIKVDRPPTCSADIVHRVVLPTARPTINYRVNDDYGIADLALHIQVERGQEEDAETTADNEQRITLHLQQSPNVLLADRLPASDGYTLDLAQLPQPGDENPAKLQLIKGDRLKLTLEATDFRGTMPGESCLSEPLVLEISDESGVLSAISEADERSEERLTEIIKQQLGIGESEP